MKHCPKMLHNQQRDHTMLDSVPGWFSDSSSRQDVRDVVLDCTTSARLVHHTHLGTPQTLLGGLFSFK